MSPAFRAAQRFIDQAVFVPVVNGAQAGAVAQLGAQLGELGVKVRHVYLAQACLAKLGGDVLHLARNGGVVFGGGHVVGTRPLTSTRA